MGRLSPFRHPAEKRVALMYWFRRLPAVLFVISMLPALSGCAPVPSAPPVAAVAGGGDIERGRAVFESNGCAGCHRIEAPLKAPTIAGTLAALGPELWYSGSKFKDGFLEGWLEEPVPIRPMEYNSLEERNRGAHVRLDKAGAADAASFLMSLAPGGGAEASPPGPSAIEADSLGRRVFNYKAACYGCHLVRTPRGLVVGGLSGPALLGVRERLRGEWIYAYLSRADTFGAVRAMPDYVGILTDEEISALAAYVAGFE